MCSDVGGGLCQLSGIMYLTALKAGLKIVERHNHTVDIYKEESERFAPLGSDATIVFGYKDLRIQNKYDFPVKFQFEITNSFIKCKLFSRKEIVSRNINFVINSQSSNQVIVDTLLNDNVIINTSCYKKI